jgi:hypothetical protein
MHTTTYVPLRPCRSPEEEDAEEEEEDAEEEEEEEDCCEVAGLDICRPKRKAADPQTASSASSRESPRAAVTTTIA